MRGNAVRDIVTTVLEIVGLLMLCIAPGIAVAAYSVPGGLATTGVLLIGWSLLLTRLMIKPVNQ